MDSIWTSSQSISWADGFCWGWLCIVLPSGFLLVPSFAVAFFSCGTTKAFYAFNPYLLALSMTETVQRLTLFVSLLSCVPLCFDFWWLGAAPMEHQGTLCALVKLLFLGPGFFALPRPIPQVSVARNVT